MSSRAALPLRLWLLLSVFLTAVQLMPTTPAVAAQRSERLRAYEGLGAWVDVYDPRLWQHPVDVVAALRAHGVQTLFLQTSTYRLGAEVFHPRVTATFLEESHRQGMKVVGWYVPDFVDLRRDLRRSLAAVRFRSSSGQGFDSFAMDIESCRVPNPSTRSARLVQLSARVRKAVGRQYPLGAIVISPVATHRVPSGWPGFPYRALSAYYDVFLPMGYYTFRTNGPRAAFQYTRSTLNLLRQDTGKTNLPIHAIGGLAESTDAEEAKAFVDAASKYHAIGASMYDFDTSGPEDWSALAKVRVEPPPRAPAPPPANPPVPTAQQPLFLRLIVIYSPTHVELWSVPFSSVRT
ncbi:MAG TPA: hypothetical protein VF660_00335 [Actinomycetota bacterium]